MTWIVESAHIGTRLEVLVSKCKKCKKDVGLKRLIVHLSNPKHRGNETDRVDIYHKKCTPKKHQHLWPKPNYRGRKDRPSREERLFWDKFPELLMDNSEDINNNLIRVIRDFAQLYFKRINNV